jgi:hypothetical protein
MRPKKAIDVKKLAHLCFVVIAEPQDWPYYPEIPYAAWPDETLEYDSYGDCLAPYDRNWSCLSVNSWSNDEVIVVLKAVAFDPVMAQQAEFRLVVRHDDDWAVWTQAGYVPLGSFGPVPSEYWRPGNVFIASLRRDRAEPPAFAARLVKVLQGLFGRRRLRAEPVALAARLFMRRLGTDLVWDGQSRQVLTQPQLEDRYLRGPRLETSDALTDEVQETFAEGEVWHREQPGYPRVWFWWKSPAHVRATIAESRETADEVSRLRLSIAHLRAARATHVDCFVRVHAAGTFDFFLEDVVEELEEILKEHPDWREGLELLKKLYSQPAKVTEVRPRQMWGMVHLAAGLIGRGRSTVYCPTCARQVPVSSVSKEEWSDGLKEWRTFGGRRFVCDQGHELLKVQDWISEQ